MAKIIIDIKDNNVPNNGDILVYSTKSKSYIRTNKSVYFKNYERKIKNCEDRCTQAESKVKYMAQVLNDYIKKGDN